MKTLHTTASVNHCKVITFTVFEEMYSSIHLTKQSVVGSQYTPTTLILLAVLALTLCQHNIPTGFK